MAEERNERPLPLPSSCGGSGEVPLPMRVRGIVGSAPAPLSPSMKRLRAEGILRWTPALELEHGLLSSAPRALIPGLPLLMPRLPLCDGTRDELVPEVCRMRPLPPETCRARPAPAWVPLCSAALPPTPRASPVELLAGCCPWEFFGPVLLPPEIVRGGGRLFQVPFHDGSRPANMPWAWEFSSPEVFGAVLRPPRPLPACALPRPSEPASRSCRFSSWAKFGFDRLHSIMLQRNW
mmetsp:Transcript_75818/g.234701  ORF Transcript_75818/g.234701 Transcript_75818/m.234701 type:complete len:236 (+) Transcript_75818:938-1645(+)